MNTAEEMALIALVQAGTSEARRRALQSLGRGRGVRLTEAARGVVIAALSNEDQRPVQFARHVGDNVARRLTGGPRPFLTPVAECDLSEWILFWQRRLDLLAGGAALPGAILLHGPPGSGKTTTAAWMASELEATMPSFVLDAHDWVSSHLGESGTKLSAAFSAMSASTAMLVLEEIDAVGGTRGTSADLAGTENTRITIALMRLIEGASFPVVATTNRLDALDPALLRRFDTIVEVSEPTGEQKAAIVRRALGRDDLSRLDLSRPIVDLMREAKRERRLAALDARTSVAVST